MKVPILYAIGREKIITSVGFKIHVFVYCLEDKRLLSLQMSKKTVASIMSWDLSLPSKELCCAWMSWPLPPLIPWKQDSRKRTGRTSPPTVLLVKAVTP